MLMRAGILIGEVVVVAVGVMVVVVVGAISFSEKWCLPVMEVKCLGVGFGLASLLTKQPFQIQWYRQEGDPEVCGHNQLPLSYEIDQTCGYCKERYKGNEEWLEFKLCDLWFHEACFEK